jgi:hypothetical protein
VTTSQDPPDVDLGELYRGPLSTFIETRNALVKRLRTEGRAEDAARVAGLRKPSTVLWALNQLGQHARDDLAELFAAGARLRAAQRRLLQGDREAADALRVAGAEQRRLADLLGRRAVMVLTASSHAASESARREIVMTLSSVATAAPGVQQELMAGRLLSEPGPAGFPAADEDATGPVPGGARAVSTAPAAETRTSRDARGDGVSAAERRDHAERLAAVQRAVDDAGRALTSAQKELDKARREAERLERRAQALTADAASATASAAQARERAESLEHTEAEAARGLEQARAELANIEA